MKLITPLLILITIISNTYSQQPDIAHVIPQPLEINPAYTGSYDQYRVDLLKNHQWIGLEDHPETFKLSAEAPLPKINSGIGLISNFYNDGSVKSIDINLGYSYRFKINELNLQLGVGCNYRRYNIDFSEMEFPNTRDLVIDDFDEIMDRFALLGGLFLYNNQFYCSLSYEDFLLYTNTDEFNYNNEMLNFISGYHFFKGKSVSICPSLFIKYYFKYSSSLGINFTSIVKNIVWVGMSYDDSERLTIGAGINIWKVHGGVRYSDIFGDVGGYGKYGAYEITMGFNFNKN